MTLQELCDKALKHAEAADRLDHGQGSVIYEAASEVLALSTLSLAYSALATIAGHLGRSASLLSMDNSSLRRNAVTTSQCRVSTRLPLTTLRKSGVATHAAFLCRHL
jgi:hypothetical protein